MALDERMMHHHDYSRPKKQNKHHHDHDRSKDPSGGGGGHRSRDRDRSKPVPTPSDPTELLAEINRLKHNIKQLDSKKSRSGKSSRERSPARSQRHDTNGHGHGHRQNHHSNGQHHGHSGGHHGGGHQGHHQGQTAPVEKIRSVESVHAEWPRLDIKERASLRRKLAKEKYKKEIEKLEHQLSKHGVKYVGPPEEVCAYTLCFRLQNMRYIFFFKIISSKYFL